MNSKQVVAAISAVALLIIIVYPALSTGTVSLPITSPKIANAEHVYVTINSVWAHRAGRSSLEGWEIISNQTKTFDLVSLGSNDTSLAKGEIPVGTYDTIKIAISNVTWIFNKTTTKLQTESSELPSSLDFTVKAAKEIVLTLSLGGYQEDIQGSKFFVPTLNATLTQT